MPSVVIDRSCIVPALRSAGSKYRAVLALTEYGRAVAFIKWGAEEWNAAPPGSRSGGPTFDTLRAGAEDVKTRLEEQLGHVTEEWFLVTSSMLLDTYEQTLLRYTSDRLEPAEVRALVRRVGLSSSLIVPRGRMLPLGVYEGIEKREEQIGIHTAVMAEADYFLTEKKALVGRVFSNEAAGTSVTAIDWSELESLTDVGGFNLREVNPRAW